ncbi:diguanylate phosphodiesterase [Amylibacter ulvae]|uniref:Diguanylate phosphodiesterase n=1 Tax=Paramylibacter ulvae TaxID=1651968 RepID=A0ABQ3D3X4_9RHOB|nr:EAL domain-containing protein [Amylibacter ulvae]GHA56507.1 diguanylate phosphodiesterase [Amylibacter ulvae]
MVSQTYKIPKRPENPFEYVVNKREEPVVETVRRAFQNKNVLLAYQPILHAKHPEKAAYYEGLIRVIDETQEVIPAKDFMPAVETSELGRILDCQALELGLAALASEPSLRLAINMSARSIGYPRWNEIINQGFAQDPTIAERLILEITESSAMLMPDIVCVFMADLHKRGVSFALDDFGAGYTAFRFFKEFQFDIVKIDGQFIKNIHQDADNQVLTTALIAIAQQFDMFTVAEHVETAEEMAFLQKVGIDCLQGFHLGKPQIVPEWTSSMYSAAG